MTEQEWLECTASRPLFDALGTNLDGRKLRLFVCACCRSIWDILPDARSRHAVEVAERFADREATQLELLEAERSAYLVWLENRTSEGGDELLLTVWSARQPVGVWHYPKDIPPAGRVIADERQAGLVRCVFGNPYRSQSPRKNHREARRWKKTLGSWLEWGGGVAQGLALVSYEERKLPNGILDDARLAVLSDALEEAGCDDAAILDHLRSPGPHVRGCHVLDLVLGKS